MSTEVNGVVEIALLNNSDDFADVAVYIHENGTDWRFDISMDKSVEPRKIFNSQILYSPDVDAVFEETTLKPSSFVLDAFNVARESAVIVLNNAVKPVNLSDSAKEILADSDVVKRATQFMFLDKCGFLNKNENIKEIVLHEIRECISELTDSCDEVSDIGYAVSEGVFICFNGVDLKDVIDKDFQKVVVDENYFNELLKKENNNEINSEDDVFNLLEIVVDEAELDCGM